MTKLHIIQENRVSGEPFHETELVVLAQQGNRSAFQQLYEHYRDRIYSLILYSLPDRSQAEDAMQTVFVKVYQTLPFFRRESSFSTWIYRVALNECKNRRRRKRLFLSLSDFQDGRNEPDQKPSPHELHASRQMDHLVQKAILELRPKHRTVVVLKYVEELSYEEMAAVLGCSRGTVASRLSRALEALEEKLRPLRRKSEVPS